MRQSGAVRSEELQGGYRFEDGQFVPEGDMEEIIHAVDRMALLGDIGTGVPSIYVDETDGSLWCYTQRADYQTTLRRVSREWVISNCPTVDIDRPPRRPDQQ
jgi:hypothetical protein